MRRGTAGAPSRAPRQGDEPSVPEPALDGVPEAGDGDGPESRDSSAGVSSRRSLARRLGRFLTRPRGGPLADAVLRSTGAVGLLGAGASVVLPGVAPLVALAVATLWMTCPLVPPVAMGQESVVLIFGRLHPPLLVGAVAAGVNLYVEYLSYHLHRRVLDMDAARRFRESGAVRKAVRLFDRRPFLAVWLCSWSPLPFFAVRVLSPLSGYPPGRHLLATFAGRFPKYWLLAFLGVAWHPPVKWIVAAVAVLAAAGAAGDAARRLGWLGGGRRSRAASGEGEPASSARVESAARPGAERVTSGSRQPVRRPGRRDPVPVLYVAASGRSGSTLVDRTLGAVEGLVSTGELSRLFGKGVAHGGLCGCGVPVPECRLWSRVLSGVRRAGHALRMERAAELRSRACEGRYAPLILLGRRPTRLLGYRRLVAATYRAVREVSGARVVVDSSKNPVYGCLLSQMPGIRVHVLHLVRDSRGCCTRGERGSRPSRAPATRPRPSCRGTARSRDPPSGPPPS